MKNRLGRWILTMIFPGYLELLEVNSKKAIYCDELTFGALAVYIALRIFLKNEQWDEFTIGFYEMDREMHPLTALALGVEVEELEKIRESAWSSVTDVRAFLRGCSPNPSPYRPQ